MIHRENGLDPGADSRVHTCRRVRGRGQRMPVVELGVPGQQAPRRSALTREHMG